MKQDLWVLRHCGGCSQRGWSGPQHGAGLGAGFAAPVVGGHVPDLPKTEGFALGSELQDSLVTASQPPPRGRADTRARPRGQK